MTTEETKKPVCKNCLDALEIIEMQKAMIASLFVKVDEALAVANKAMKTGLEIAQFVAPLVNNPEVDAILAQLTADFNKPEKETHKDDI